MPGPLRAGAKQRIATGLAITSGGAVNTVGVVRNTYLAAGVLLKFWNGVGAFTVQGLTVKGSWDGVNVATDGAAYTSNWPTGQRIDKTENVGPACYCFMPSVSGSGTAIVGPILHPFLVISLTGNAAGASDVTGVNLDAWPILDSELQILNAAGPPIGDYGSPVSMYTAGIQAIMTGVIVPSTDATLKFILLKPTYNFNAAHALVSDISAFELTDDAVTGSAYRSGFAGTGRVALTATTNRTFPVDLVNHFASMTVAAANQPTWPVISSTNGAVGWAVLYQPGATDADSLLISAIQVVPTHAADGKQFSLPAEVDGYIKAFGTGIVNGNPLTVDNAIQRMLSGNVLPTSNTLKVMLLTPAYVPSLAHNFVSEISSFELASIPGYVPGFAGAGRKTLASKSVVIDAANGAVKLLATAPTWPALGNNVATVGWAALIKEVTNDAASPVLSIIEIPDIVPRNETLTLTIPADGLLRLQARGLGKVTIP